MKITDLRNYGAAFSQAEATWPPEVKKRMRKAGKGVVMRHVRGLDKLRFAWLFFRAKRRAAHLDLSDLREQGMTDQAFLSQQLEYLAMFSALAELFDSERAVAIMKEVMDEAAHEPLLMCLPDPSNVRAVGDDALSVFHDYIGAMAQASVKAGCNQMEVVDEEGRDAFVLNVTWCVWLELAERMGVPEGCQPNCYSDDLVFPEYFADLGVRYTRTQTLACGGSCCDFGFARGEPDQP